MTVKFNELFVMLSSSTKYITRTTISSNTTLTNQHCLVAVTGGVPLTVTLPAASSVLEGRFYKIVDETGTAGTDNITIAADGSDTIIGEASILISDNYNSITVYSDGSTKWFIC